MDSVAAGEYRIGVAGMPPDFYIKEARIGANDILQDGFSMPRPQSDRFEILLSPNSGGRTVIKIQAYMQ